MMMIIIIIIINNNNNNNNNNTNNKVVKKVGTQVQFFQHDQISDLRWPDNKKENGMIKCITAYSHKVT